MTYFEFGDSKNISCQNSGQITFIWCLGNEVSLKDIRAYFLKEVPGLAPKGIRKDVTHFLRVPLNKNTIRVEPYKYLIDARVPHKKTITEKKKYKSIFFIYSNCLQRRVCFAI